MSRAWLLTALIALAGAAGADEPPPDWVERMRQLERRVRELEARSTPTVPPPAPQPPPAPLDVREPPFAEYDFSWLDGSNRQPSSLLTSGPLTWSIYVDGYYQWQFAAPVDHTVFPSSSAPRHNELSLNLVALGVEINLDGPIGRVYVQYGSNTETIAGQDPTTSRGFYLSNRAFNYIQQAAGGWHFHWLHGVNLEVGLFSSYFSVESYLPQENWSYTHALVSDATPYYFSGIRAQIFPTRRLKVELWLVNGWQTFGQWHEGRAGGWDVTFRPREWLSLSTNTYFGQDAVGDAGSFRFYSDSFAQLRYHRGARVRSAALVLLADVGYERRSSAPSGPMAALMIAHRVEWTARWATALRVDLLYDKTQAIIPQLPIGSPYRLPNTSSAFLGGGFTVTQDFLPSPWLLLRVEYAHRQANVPYFSGPGGLTGPGGVPAANPSLFAPDLRSSDDRILVNATLRL